MKIKVPVVIVLILFYIVLSHVSFAQTEKIHLQNVNQEKLEIKALIDSLYAGFRVEGDLVPDFQKIRTYFSPEAKMGSVVDGDLRLSSPDDYLTGMEKMVKEDPPKLLKELELSGKTQVFGHLAQHISSYGVYFNTTDSFAEKGVIAYQLVKLDGKWKVLSMIWDKETETRPIPDFGSN
ncbi:MAG: hypothetical protein HWE15_04975 [Algoriphagus sp.]|uniref:hypothetical protein n=1 Tax=Algoriphagus sp. TaxID=1872435 RepID=UPI00185BB4CF|nr:hypothetical protein [Algoriphagus sp.]NVJ85635.1 hypothetical protein [Algoriphagus sp.]